MVDNNGFGNSDNPWDDDPSKNQNPDVPQQPTPPTPPTPMQPAIPMPPPPAPPVPPTGAPSVGTYYGNAQGYGVSGPINDGMGIASMVLGIISIVIFCIWFVAPILAILAIALGGVSLSKISKSNGHIIGKGFAIAGLVCGILSIAATIIFWLIAINSSSFNW